MKIVVISDCHGDIDAIRRIAQTEYKGDLFLMLGDSELPSDMITPFVSVKGNCDHFYDYPLEKIIKTPYGNILMEHGHLRNEISIDYLKEKECKIYLFGHTHRHMLKKIDEFYFANPGSVSRPRDDTNGSYLVIEADSNGFNFIFKYL